MKELLTGFCFLICLPLSVMAAGMAAEELAPGLFHGTSGNDNGESVACYQGSPYNCD